MSVVGTGGSSMLMWEERAEEPVGQVIVAVVGDCHTVLTSYRSQGLCSGGLVWLRRVPVF